MGRFVHILSSSDKYMIFFHVFLSLSLLYSAYTDFKTHKIKNYITFPLMLIGLLGNFYLNGLKGLEFALKGMFFSFIIGLVFFYVLRIGMGDVKLFMGIGCFLGYYDTGIIIIISFILAFIIGFFQQKGNTLKNLYLIICNLVISKKKTELTENESKYVPLGIYIFLGYILYLFLVFF